MSSLPLAETMFNLPNSVLDEGREREIEGMITTLRLQGFRPIYERGFEDGIPPNVELWEIEPPTPDRLEPAERKASIFRDIAWLSQGNYGLNDEQVEALAKAFDAPGGLGVVDGKSKSGKTSLAVAQALITAWTGHKVLVCSPNEEDQEIAHAFESFMKILPKGRSRRIYWAVNGPEWTAAGAKLELLALKKHSHKKLPALMGYGMVRLLKADIQTLKTPKYQEKLKDRDNNHVELEPLLESLALCKMWGKMEDDTQLMDIGRFNALYRKVYARVVADSDILITCCDRAGIEDIYPYFKPTVVIIDNCNLATVHEAWIPLLTYSGTRIRTLIGDSSKSPVLAGDQNKPETNICPGSLMGLLASRRVPIHELKTQYSVVDGEQGGGVAEPGEAAGQDGRLGLATMEDVHNDGEGFIGRRKPCHCGSQKKFKNCCGKGDGAKGESSSKNFEGTVPDEMKS